MHRGRGVVDELGEVEHRGPAQQQVERDVEPARRPDPEDLERHAEQGAAPHEREHDRGVLRGQQEQRERRVGAGDQQEDVGVVEALPETLDPVGPGAAVIDRADAEQQHRADHEHRDADAHQDVLGDHEHHDECEERQRQRDGVQPPTQLGLDLVDGLRGSGSWPRARCPRAHGRSWAQRSAGLVLLWPAWESATSRTACTSDGSSSGSIRLVCRTTSVRSSTATAVGPRVRGRGSSTATRPVPTRSRSSPSGVTSSASRSSRCGCCRPTTSSVRPQEVGSILAAVEGLMEKLAGERRWSLAVIGNLDMLPTESAGRMKRLADSTAGRPGHAGQHLRGLRRTAGAHRRDALAAARPGRQGS